jgi:hypothetical protein
MPAHEIQLSDDQVALDGISAIQFRTLVDSLSEWISNGLVKIRFGPQPQPEFDDNKMATLLKEKNLPQICVSLIKWDIPLMVYGILTGSRGIIINFLSSNAGVRKSKTTKAPTTQQIEATTSARLAYVEEVIVTPGLRKQYAIKDKSKTNLYYSAAWEVVRSQSQSDISVPLGLVYTILRIDTLKPSPKRSDESFIIPINAIKSSELESIALTMTLQDLLDLIENLNHAVKAAKESIDSEAKQ